MCSMRDFATCTGLAHTGEETLGEVSNQLVCGEERWMTMVSKGLVPSHIPNADIDVAGMICKPVGSDLTENSLNESALQSQGKHETTWLRMGFVDSTKECHNRLSNLSKGSFLSKCLYSFGSTCIAILQFLQTKHIQWLSNRCALKDIRDADFCRRIIRAIAVHPHTGKVAVCTVLDAVHVVYSDSQYGGAIRPELRHTSQVGVRSMSWRPCYSSMLAVGCEGCVLVWTVDPQSIAARLSSSCVVVLKQQGPVTSVEWLQQGNLLATASNTSNSFHVWDVCTEQATQIYRGNGGGVSLLRCSPDGRKFAVAGHARILRVWNACDGWSCEKWTALPGFVQAACWDKYGDVLLFAVSEKCAIYALVFASDTIIQLVDTSEVMIKEEILGGFIHQLAVDMHGERLAVLFKNDNGSSIALFSIQTSPSLYISPVGKIHGREGELPNMCAFQGSNLFVAWSSGRLSNVPLVYEYSKKRGKAIQNRRQ